MAQITPSYEILPEYKKIADALIKKYPDAFYGIPILSIRAVAISNKDRSEKCTDYFKVKAVSMPMALDCPFSHYVIFYLKDWTEMAQANKILLVASSLQAIPKDSDGDSSSTDAKINSYDLKDWNIMVRTFGPDYLEKDVKNILEDEIEFIS